MAQSQTMTGADGANVTAYRRAARNVQAGDWLPEHGAHAAGAPLTDPDDGSVWVTLDTGVDVRFTPRGKVWLHRRYTAPAWMAEAVATYRDARDARDAMRESSLPAPTSVAGAAGSGVAWYQLEPADFNRAYPAPRLADFIREAAAAYRAGSDSAA